MRLPPLSWILGIQAVLWCVAGAFVLGVQILLYPLVWTLVIGGFLLHLKCNPLQRLPASGPSPHVVGSRPKVDETPPAADNNTSQKLAAS